MESHLTGSAIRQAFIDYFIQKGHTFVPSSSLVPGGDQTLLFTNAGMVQFKDVFLGTDQRPYKRAANSQKCMRVSGKQNDLDEVGRDNTHHTFFEMLGNWSFGDYYKKEAITWAWELLTEVWGLPKERLYPTCFKDEKGEIPTDEEAAENWLKQPGILPDHVLFFGRKDNFWEMAEVGPCGPCSEIHMDLGIERCNKQNVPGHVCHVNGDCQRFLEIWNLVFIQFNRLDPTTLEPLPACHVDTGMGLDRVTSILQKTYSNYKTDLLFPLLEKVRKLTGQTPEEMEANFTPYRVIADHARAAAFLIGDGVVPGNTGRNYVCRMIVRRAARFGTKIGLLEPFMAGVAEVVIENYGDHYPELKHNRESILDSITREEKQFQRTIEQGMARFDELLSEVRSRGESTLSGEKAFELFATHGLPIEITTDIAREAGLVVDLEGFKLAKDEHSKKSRSSKGFGPQSGENVDTYRGLLVDLQSSGEIGPQGVEYDPYSTFEVEAKVVGIISEGEPVLSAITGDKVEVILPQTCFYIESGGQISDTGTIVSVNDPRWEIRIDDVRKPAAGVIVHVGEVVRGQPAVGDLAIATVDIHRRQDIMRNHTATHLLHAELHAVLGKHALQAGSLVAPDRLRFDFNHPEAVTPEQLERIEAGVNRAIYADYSLDIKYKPLAQALGEGATALFGEKYGETVRTITIGGAEPFSYELCGGTHVAKTGDIGIFLITSEGSAAAGVRRIEAVTGREAYSLIQRRFKALKQSAAELSSALDEVPEKVKALLEDLSATTRENLRLRQQLVSAEFETAMSNTQEIGGIHVLAVQLTNADADTLRQMTDRFRQKYTSSVIVVSSIIDSKPMIIAAVSDDLVKQGWRAGDLVKTVAQVVGGGGGGRPNLAQAGGKDADKLPEAMQQVIPWVRERIK